MHKLCLLVLVLVGASAHPHTAHSTWDLEEQPETPFTPVTSDFRLIGPDSSERLTFAASITDVRTVEASEWKSLADEVLGGQHVMIGPLPTSGAKGHVFYDLAGPVDGPLVVLVDGIYEWLYRYDWMLPALHREGFRTLRYDHWNRGFTDDIEHVMDDSVYLETLEALLLAVEATRSVNMDNMMMVAHSMGGAIATSYVATHPGEVQKLVLMSPAGYGKNTLARILGAIARRADFLHSLSVALLSAMSEGAMKDDFFNPDSGITGQRYRQCANMNRLMTQHKPKALWALTSTVAYFKGLIDVQDDASAIAYSGISCPVLLLTGSHDKTVDTATTVKSFIKIFSGTLQMSSVKIYDQTRHLFFVERAQDVNVDITDFLTGRELPRSNYPHPIRVPVFTNPNPFAPMQPLSPSDPMVVSAWEFNPGFGDQSPPVSPPFSPHARMPRRSAPSRVQRMKHSAMVAHVGSGSVGRRRSKSAVRFTSPTRVKLGSPGSPGSGGGAVGGFSLNGHAMERHPRMSG